MQQSYTILVDTREQTPLQFPAHLPILNPNKLATDRVSTTVHLNVVSSKLETGDYALQGFGELCLIERKGGIREVAKNCLDPTDRKRFIKCLDRLKSSCLHPYLMLEGSLLDMTHDRHVPDWWNAVDALHRLLLERNIGLILLPNTGLAQRKLVGEWVARLLVNAALCPILPATPTEEPACPTTSAS